MADIPIYTKIFGHKAVIVTVSDTINEGKYTNNNFAVKIVDLYDNNCEKNIWSLNKGEDMCLVIRALETEDFSLLNDASVYAVPLACDLYHNGIIDDDTFYFLYED